MTPGSKPDTDGAIGFVALAHAVERELGNVPLEVKGFRLLPTWLCCVGETLALVRYEDIAWVYRTQRNTQLLLVIEAVEETEEPGRRGSVLVRVEHSVTAPEADRLLADLAGRTPCAIHGWNPALEANRPNVLREFERCMASQTNRALPAA